MNKNIAIITINDNNNYGNRLQNYALFRILSKNNNVFNIENYHLYNNKSTYFFRKIKYFRFNMYYSSDEKKRQRFKKFNNYIRNYSGIYSPYNKYDDIDYFIVGSDQVWHPTYSLDDATTLKNFSPEKRVSYAASFGVEKTDESAKKYIRTEISKFKAISVREETGARIVKKETGRDAVVLIDPTMMLNKIEWSEISIRPDNMIDEGYILTYFLSPISNIAKNILEHESNGRRVVKLLDDSDNIAKTAGPSEFLYLFEHADLILTDSFHACVFSFIFDKPFVVFDRNISGQSMNSRLETLLSKFKIERKYYGYGLENDIWEHNYEEGYAILEEERKKAYDFLKDALGD